MADLGAGLQDHEAEPPFGEVPGHGQPSLAPPDHHRIQHPTASRDLLRLAVGGGHGATA